MLSLRVRRRCAQFGMRGRSAETCLPDAQVTGLKVSAFSKHGISSYLDVAKIAGKNYILTNRSVGGFAGILVVFVDFDLPEVIKSDVSCLGNLKFDTLIRI